VKTHLSDDEVKGPAAGRILAAVHAVVKRGQRVDVVQVDRFGAVPVGVVGDANPSLRIGAKFWSGNCVRIRFESGSLNFHEALLGRHFEGEELTGRQILAGYLAVLGPMLHNLSSP